VKQIIIIFSTFDLSTCDFAAQDPQARLHFAPYPKLFLAMRPIVSYEDISLPYTSPSQPGPPAKKRKRNNQRKNKQQQHWNNPSTSASAQVEQDEEEESRELTQEEIWDDSALIQAWDAANEEYEVRVASLPSSYLTIILGISWPGKGLERGHRP
jgi:hypothetical protein